MNPTVEFAALFELPVEQRRELAERLWESVEAEQDALPVSAAVLTELSERKARYDANPASGVSWRDAQRRLREEGGCAS